MKKFIIKMLILAIPFLGYAAIFIMIDPYNMFSVSKIVNDATKLKISYPRQVCLWKALEYRNHPIPNLLLGDSRMVNINAEQVSALCGEKYYNFAHLGASLPEIIDSFWFASKCCRLKNVYLGVNLNNYNANVSWNRFNDVESLLGNRLLYFTNGIVLESLFHIVYDQITEADVKANRPESRDKNDSWKYNLNVVPDRYYKNSRYPKDYFLELKKIAGYYNRHGIRLTVIIFPTHVDLQNKLLEYGLSAAIKSFKSDMAQLGDVFDFDYPNGLTNVKDNFQDPFHTLRPDLIISEIWGGRIKYARFTKRINTVALGNQ